MLELHALEAGYHEGPPTNVEEPLWELDRGSQNQVDFELVELDPISLYGAVWEHCEGMELLWGETLTSEVRDCMSDMHVCVAIYL